MSHPSGAYDDAGARENLATHYYSERLVVAQKVWFITGVSRGLGLAIARAAIEAGDEVVGTTRDGLRPPQLDSPRCKIVRLEASDIGAIAAVVAEAHRVHDRLDVVVNNAGYGLIGPVEAASVEDVQRQFAVNVLAPIAVIRAVLPMLRRRRSGHIINLSSIAGLAPAPGAGLYAASKAALWALSQSLAQEVEPFGISVTVVSPGPFRTEFLSARSVHQTGDLAQDYQSTVTGDALGRLMRRAGIQTGDPDRAAQALIEIVNSPKPPVDLLLGADALARLQEQRSRFEREVQDWRHLTVGADFGA